MSIIDLEIGCDSANQSPPCGDRLTLTGAKSMKLAIQMLSMAGWRHDSKTDLDYCPTCSQLLDDLGGVQSNIDPTSME